MPINDPKAYNCRFLLHRAESPAIVEQHAGMPSMTIIMALMTRPVDYAQQSKCDTVQSGEQTMLDISSILPPFSDRRLSFRMLHVRLCTCRSQQKLQNAGSFNLVDSPGHSQLSHTAKAASSIVHDNELDCAGALSDIQAAHFCLTVSSHEHGSTRPKLGSGCKLRRTRRVWNSHLPRKLSGKLQLARSTSMHLLRF